MQLGFITNKKSNNLISFNSPRKCENCDFELFCLVSIEATLKRQVDTFYCFECKEFCASSTFKIEFKKQVAAKKILDSIPLFGDECSDLDFDFSYLSLTVQQVPEAKPSKASSCTPLHYLEFYDAEYTNTCFDSDDDDSISSTSLELNQEWIEEYESSDQTSFRFFETLSLEPLQLIRWGKTALLPYQRIETLKCTVCRKDKEFLYQIMPGMIEFCTGIDFLTIMIFVCSCCDTDQKETGIIVQVE